MLNNLIKARKEEKSNKKGLQVDEAKNSTKAMDVNDPNYPYVLGKYNTLATKISKQIKNNKNLKEKDVELLKNLYSKIPDKQKKQHVMDFPKFPPPPSKPKSIAQNGEKTGYLQINNEKHFYVTDKNGKTKYFNRWGAQVNSNGRELIKSHKSDFKIAPDVIKAKLKKGHSGYIYTKDEMYYFTKGENEKNTVYNKWGNVVDMDEIDINKITGISINSNKAQNQKNRKKISKI